MQHECSSKKNVEGGGSGIRASAKVETSKCAVVKAYKYRKIINDSQWVLEADY
jgi:hypothetical protein